LALSPAARLKVMAIMESNFFGSSIEDPRVTSMLPAVPPSTHLRVLASLLPLAGLFGVPALLRRHSAVRVLVAHGPKPFERDGSAPRARCQVDETAGCSDDEVGEPELEFR
jgi:hypothetical protein